MPDDAPTPPLSASERAQQWHEEQVAADPEHEQFGSCWCCCLTCDPDGGADGNPYWHEAQKEGRREYA
jgi:hypothetical protein